MVIVVYLDIFEDTGSLTTREVVVSSVFLTDQYQLFITRENLNFNDLLLVHAHYDHIFKLVAYTMLPQLTLRVILEILHIHTCLSAKMLFHDQIMATILNPVQTLFLTVSFETIHIGSVHKLLWQLLGAVP